MYPEKLRASLSFPVKASVPDEPVATKGKNVVIGVDVPVDDPLTPMPGPTATVPPLLTVIRPLPTAVVALYCTTPELAVIVV